MVAVVVVRLDPVEQTRMNDLGLTGVSDLFTLILDPIMVEHRPCIKPPAVVLVLGVGDDHSLAGPHSIAARMTRRTSEGGFRFPSVRR